DVAGRRRANVVLDGGARRRVGDRHRRWNIHCVVIDGALVALVDREGVVHGDPRLGHRPDHVVVIGTTVAGSNPDRRVVNSVAADHVVGAARPIVVRAVAVDLDGAATGTRCDAGLVGRVYGVPLDRDVVGSPLQLDPFAERVVDGVAPDRHVMG